METQTKEKAVNFGRLSDAFNNAFKNPDDPEIIKKWEEIFDEKLTAPANTISGIVKYISAWCCYVPPSRRIVLLNRLIAEAKTPKALHDCLASTIDWKKKEKEELEKAWQEVSKHFFRSNEPFLPKKENLIVLVNNIFYLASPWQSKAITKVSQFITVEIDDNRVKEYSCEITTPGDLTDEACLRFLKTAKNEEEARDMISKLSLVNQEEPPEKIYLQRVGSDETRKKRILILWEELRLSKFLKTRTVTAAKKIINDFAPTNSHADILRDTRACHHLARFINNYKTGKMIYQMIIAIHGKNSLIAVPAMKNWSPYLSLRLMDANFPDEKLHELYGILFGEMKNKIREIYCERVVHLWLTNPL